MAMIDGVSDVMEGFQVLIGCVALIHFVWPFFSGDVLIGCCMPTTLFLLNMHAEKRRDLWRKIC